VVNDDLGGVAAIVQWLGYVARKQGAMLPIISSIDPVDRDIGFLPSDKYDPRHMLAGCHLDGQWTSGFFDIGSWTATLGGWGKTVVTGRARLGGIPVGVIAVETRTVELVYPADPADPKSQEMIIPQAAHVWFPDSAYKTAQAIQDFNFGEELPLIIFANWRGFSGGMRDMFLEILKFGSMIVDNLRKYRQPIFIYLPPGAELRGGAWVVLDSTINPRVMEMYADTDSRGGVLEPSGSVEIKYRDRDFIKTMQRPDDTLMRLDSQLRANNLSESETASIKAQTSSREKELLPFYQQMALKFADLHDTPGRMKAKGVVRDMVPWQHARKYFYHRLRRRLLELRVHRRMLKANPTLTHEDTARMTKEWLLRQDSSLQLDDDQQIASLLEIQKTWAPPLLKALKTEWIIHQVNQLAAQDPAVVRQVLTTLTQ